MVSGDVGGYNRLAIIDFGGAFFKTDKEDEIAYGNICTKFFQKKSLNDKLIDEQKSIVQRSIQYSD